MAKSCRHGYSSFRATVASIYMVRFCQNTAARHRYTGRLQMGSKLPVYVPCFSMRGWIRDPLIYAGNAYRTRRKRGGTLRGAWRGGGGRGGRKGKTGG